MGEKSKSKLEIVQQKKIERAELEKMYDYNPFGRSGAGAPLKDNQGKILSGRKTIENNLWKDQGNPYESGAKYVNSQMNGFMMQQPIIQPQQFIPLQQQMIFPQPQFNPYQPNMIYSPNQYLPQMNPYNLNFYNPFNYNMQPTNQIQAGNPDLQHFLNNTGSNYINNNQPQTSNKISEKTLPEQPNKSLEQKYMPEQQNTLRQYPTNLPPAKSINQEENEKVKRLQYQNLLLKQIEENKRRKEEEKQKLWEANRLEEQRIRDYNDKLNETSRKEHEKRLRCNSALTISGK